MTRQGRPAALGLSVFYFVHFASFGAYLPYFPRWLESLGVTGSRMGLVLGVAPAVGVLAPPLVGALADALGLRAQLLRVAAVVAALSMFGLAAFASAATDLAGPTATAAIALAVAVTALARTPLFGIADVLTLESLGERKEGFGRIRMWGSLGFVAAVAALGAVIDVSHRTSLPLAIGGLFLATAVAALFVPARPAPLAGPSRAALVAMRRHLPFFAAIALWQLGNAAYDTTFTLRARDAGASDLEAGLLWGAGVLAEVALMAFGPRVLRAGSVRSLLLVGIAASAARYAGVALAPSLAALFAVQPLHAITFGVTWLAANAQLPHVAHGDRLATAQGALAASVAVGSVAGSLLWPTLYESASARVVFAGASACALAGLLPASLVSREGR